MSPYTANAADISGDQITASTSMPIWGNYTIEKIADDIEEGPSGYNGFTTTMDKGIITLDFDKA